MRKVNSRVQLGENDTCALRGGGGEIESDGLTTGPQA